MEIAIKTQLGVNSALNTVFISKWLVVEVKFQINGKLKMFLLQYLCMYQKAYLEHSHSQGCC